MAVFVADQVYVDVVSLLQAVVSGHSVADHVIHRSAHALWEVHVVDCTWVSILSDYKVVHQLVHIVQGHSHLKAMIYHCHV